MVSQGRHFAFVQHLIKKIPGLWMIEERTALINQLQSALYEYYTKLQ